MKGALLLGLSPKGGDDDSSDSSEDSYLKEAFSALKDDDLDGFKSAMKAFKSCSSAGAESGDDEDKE